jgi:hypothetical protein
MRILEHGCRHVNVITITGNIVHFPGRKIKKAGPKAR